jgi:oxepin-CoA hydrolase/3-oxo-5,6-dehydrosuberyl-CoA semialdehyde dehydrogenase
MKTLRSYIAGRWHEAEAGFSTLYNPSTEEPIARASSDGIDFGEALAYARERGGPALRQLSFAQRADLLRGMSRALRESRDELLAFSASSTGTTIPDGSFDIDGGSGTLAYYGALGKGLGDRHTLLSGEGVRLASTDAFWGRHVLVPRQGVAVCVNAFNFPVWGFAEKAACALLAGMPVIVKPATATALLTERAIEILIEKNILPHGALQLVCGSTGDLLDRLGGHDVLAFTGSAATANSLRNRPSLLEASVRTNVEADSLNAATLAPDVEPGSPAWELFVRDVVREMTQKSGQKCTAIRRILVPRARLSEVEEALVAVLERVVTGNPADAATTMGPLATAAQLADAIAGLGELRRDARLVHGAASRTDGNGSPQGKGYFLAPTLLRADDARAARAVHQREVFAPVATLMTHDGSARDAAELVGLGGGTLVGSVHTDDLGWLQDFFALSAPTTGRLYWGSTAAVAEAFGSGAALPQMLHGGPGRAGGGAELAGLAGLELYMQKVAVQGARGGVDALLGV